jgi:hypothetical protein
MAVFIEADGIDMSFESSITILRTKATGLVHGTSCVGVNGFLATKHPKKHQNGHLPGVNNHFRRHGS